MGKEEDISIDFSKVKAFFGTKKGKDALRMAGMYVLPIFLLLFLVYLSTDVRTSAVDIPIADSWAANSVRQSLTQSITQQVAQERPGMSDERRAELVNFRVQEVFNQDTVNLNGQTVSIRNTISQQANNIRSQFQHDEYNHVYLSDLDTYYYYRLARNYNEIGAEYEFQDENGRYHDSKIMAGRPLQEGVDHTLSNFHTLAISWFHNLWELFNSDVSFLETSYYISVALMPFAIIPAFFIGRRFAGNLGGFFAGFIVALHPALLGRTMGGIADTDPYVAVWPLMCAWVLIESIYAKKMWSRVTLGVLAGFTIGMYAFSWQGFTSTFVILLAVPIVYIAFLIAKQFPKIAAYGLVGALVVLLLLALGVAFNIVAILLAIFAVVLLYLGKEYRKDLKKLPSYFKKDEMVGMLYVLGTFIVSSGLFISLLKGSQFFWSVPRSILGFVQIKDVATTSMWPNVFTTVAELNPASVGQTINNMSYGSNIFLFIALFGLVVSLIGGIKDVKKHRVVCYSILAISAAWYAIFISSIQTRITSQLLYLFFVFFPVLLSLAYLLYKKIEVDIRFSLLLLLWFAATFYATSKGVRFVMLTIPVFALMVGVCLGRLAKFLAETLADWVSINQKLLYVGFILLALVFTFQPINIVGAAEQIANQQVPMMNDGWYSTLAKIDDQATEDAIINSWWDFGHWFTAIGNRRVTLDGGTQNNPAAHWLGKLMVTRDETESKGILRYLDCGSNEGFNVLSEKLDDELDAVLTVSDIISMDRSEAEQILRAKGVAEPNDVLQYTHCEPPENYFITSEDMVGKSGVWAHFGTWDFVRSTMFNRVHAVGIEEGRRILEEDYDILPEDSQKMYYEIKGANPDQWISAWPSYASQFGNCAVQGNNIVCPHIGLIFDLTTETPRFETQQGTLIPKTYEYINADGEYVFVENTGENVIRANNGRDLGVAIVPSGAGFQAILMDSELGGSMFTRLFYFRGHGLEYFKEFHAVRDITGQNIYVWKIDWDGGEENVVYTSRAPAVEVVPSEETEEVSDDEASDNEVAEEDLSEDEETVQDDTTESEGANENEAIVAEDEVAPEAQEIDEGYKFVKVDRIIFSTEERSVEDALALANEAFELLSVDSFETVQESYNDLADDPYVDTWLPQGFDESFVSIAFSLEEGAYSEPFESENGVEIVRLTEVK